MGLTSCWYFMKFIVHILNFKLSQLPLREGEREEEKKKKERERKKEGKEVGIV